MSWRSCTTAMLGKARLMRRLPARERRWRCWSPFEASSGAVPFQEATCPRSAKRVMSPTSPISRAALEGPMPLSSCRLLPVALTRSVSCAFAALIFLSIPVRSVMSSAASCRRGASDDVPWTERGQQNAGR